MRAKFAARAKIKRKRQSKKEKKIQRRIKKLIKKQRKNISLEQLKCFSEASGTFMSKSLSSKSWWHSSFGPYLHASWPLRWGP